jgi:hypothetical protein
MEDQQNADIPTKGHGEKYDFESQDIPMITPATNRSQLLSKKLLDWGVEARGTCRI